MTPEVFLQWAIDASFVLLVIGLIFSFLRLVKGPTQSDRVVALDMMTIMIVAFCGLFSMLTGETVFIDIAVVLALVGFLTTLALARFAERARLQNKDEDDHG